MSKAVAEKIKHGQALGVIEVNEALRAAATDAARLYWKAQVADEFMEQVETCRGDKAFPLNWLPVDQLARYGFVASPKDSHWVMTTGVTAHIDRDWGPTLVWVLVNDGMYFKQGRERIVHKAGEWYIFNDAALHEVDALKTSPAEAVYLGWAVRLKDL
ncbi:hypothetical protein [Polaromonas sp.]|uniref:hypothetical protein n=1 Tax=Polaromonas sp. TaxID=1869339 RepID=UPI00352AA469